MGQGGGRHEKAIKLTRRERQREEKKKKGKEPVTNYHSHLSAVFKIQVLL